MRVYRDLTALPDFKNCVITIGSFDGIHIGHQRILDRIKQLSREHGSDHVVVTFHPHPRSIVYPKDTSLKLLSSLKEKISLFKSFDIENLVIVPFTIEFSQISAIEYVEKFLVKNFKPKFIVIGYDHKFGLNRSGDINLLKNKKQDYGFEVIEISKQEIEEITISSSKIRSALHAGDLETANTLLNHPYEISGIVIRGRKLGTEIGFPTANLSVENKSKLIPKDGIYCCTVDYKDKSYNGMLYIGDIPTIGTDNPKSIEVNIFNFNEDIYDKRISIKILHYLRDDKKFEGIESLKQQLIIDRDNSLKFFERYSKEKISKVSIAILNYNTQSHLETYLPSVTSSSANDFETVLIDNGSSDDSLGFVSEWFPEIKIISLPQNYGFAEGYNLGLKEVNAEYVVLLNSDVRVTENWLDPIIQFLDAHKEYAAAMPKILSVLNNDQFEYAGACGGFIDYLAYPFCRGRVFETIEDDEGQYDKTIDIFWASGAAFVIRKSVFDKLGGFDGDYFAHQEEIDLCWRIHRAGFKVAAIPESTVYHLGGGTLDYTNSKKLYLNFRNSLYTLYKNEEKINLIWKIPTRLILDGIAGLKFLLSGQLSSFMAIIKAHFSFYPTISSLNSKRKDFNTILKSNNFNKPNKEGIFHKSILIQYYLLGKKKYSDIFSK